MVFTYDPIFAADPNNTGMVAKNAAITIFDPADPNKTPVTLADVTGSPLPNPITVNAAGFGPAFQHPTLDRVGWSGGGFSNYFTSYEGMKTVATDAKAAADLAASNAGAAAAADLATRVAAGQFKGANGSNGANGANGKDGLNGSNVLPTDDAIEQAINGAGTKTKAALNATFDLKGDGAAAAAAAVAPVQDQIDFIADSTLTQKTQRVPDAVTWLTTFTTGHGWSADNAPMNVNSTDVTLFGTQGAKYGPSAAIGSTRKDLTLDLTNRMLVLAMKSLDDNGNGIIVYLGDTGALANYRTYSVSQDAHRAEDGWVFVTINPNEFGSQVGTLNLASIGHVRVVMQASTVAHTKHIGGIGYAPIPTKYPNGVISIDFDDSVAGQFTLARPLMVARNFPGTICAIGQAAESSTELNVANMHLLEDVFGWEIGAHSHLSSDHVSMQTLTDEQIADSVLRIRQWLTSNGFKANYFAYPNGGNDARVRAVVRKYFSIARVAGAKNQALMTPPVTSSEIFTVPTQVATAANVSTILAAIDKAAASKTWQSITFHGIIAGGAGVGTGFNVSVTDFTTILDRIVSKGCAVVTPSTIYGLTK